jgi:hypothetical protein
MEKQVLNPLTNQVGMISSERQDSLPMPVEENEEIE